MNKCVRCLPLLPNSVSKLGNVLIFNLKDFVKILLKKLIPDFNPARYKKLGKGETA
jgi:hypothetical protein